MIRRLLIALALATPAAAQPVVEPIGDGVRASLARYAMGGFDAQCIAGGRGGAPALVVTVDGRETPVEVPPIGFPDGPPVLWISSEHGGRATLEAVVQGAIPDARVVHLELDAVPTGFAGLRFARLILIAAADFGRLDPARRRAVSDAVSAGVTLVVGTGEAGAAADALRALAPVTLGEVSRPTGALADHLGRASAQRALEPGDRARAMMVADGHPVVVDAPHGLGRVRVIAVRLNELEDGALARAALTPPSEPLGHVLRWLAQAPPHGERRASPFGTHIWLLLTILAALVMMTRRRPRLALALAVPWWFVALFMPPQWTETRLDDARVLYVPAPDGALAIGTLDLTLTRGGARTLDAVIERVALEDAIPGGACLITGEGAAGWVVDGEAGSPRRVTFFAMFDAMPEGDDKLGELPEWPDGALAGATLRRVQAGPLPTALGAGHVDAVRAEPRPPARVAPLVLESP